MEEEQIIRDKEELAKKAGYFLQVGGKAISYISLMTSCYYGIINENIIPVPIILGSCGVILGSALEKIGDDVQIEILSNKLQRRLKNK